jgi:hypothetical protein
MENNDEILYSNKILKLLRLKEYILQNSAKYLEEVFEHARLKDTAENHKMFL